MEAKRKQETIKQAAATKAKKKEAEEGEKRQTGSQV